MAASKDFDEILARLALPFTQSSIEFVVTYTYGDTYDAIKIGVAPYVKRESILTRLDVVCGPAGWSNEIDIRRSDAIFNGIIIYMNIGNEKVPITKWDGASVVQNKSKNDRLDSIKTASTNSFKRSAELWGVGRYLKDLPELHAIKRPSNYYDSDEFTKKTLKQGNQTTSFTVRWDHPQLPREFLPEFMTPEQFVALKGLRKHFSDKQAKPINDYIAAFEKDWQSVPYDDVATIIYDTRQFIKSKVKRLNPKEVFAAPNKTSPPKKKSATTPKEAQSDEGTVDLNDDYSIVKGLKGTIDYMVTYPELCTAPLKDLKASQNFINNVILKKRPVPDTETLNNLIAKINEWEADMVEDLPFN